MSSHKMLSLCRWLLLSAASAVVISAVGYLSMGCDETIAASIDQNKARVERGKYLVSIAGCHDCHTPFKMGEHGPEPDMSRMLSGHPNGFKVTTPPKGDEAWSWHGAATNTAFAGPWGVSFAMNLTPDELTGIGSWTEDIFIKAIRTGKHWGQSRPILPPMPWPVYRNMTDEDLKSVFAYLRTIPAIDNEIPLPHEPVPQ